MVTLYWSHWHAWRGGRTYGRTVTKIKFSRIDVLPYFLNYGALRAPPLLPMVRTPELRYECYIIMQIQRTKNLNPGRFELDTTLS